MTTATPWLRTVIVSAWPACAHTHSHPLPGPVDPRLGPGPQGAQEDTPGLEGGVTSEMQEGPPHSGDPLQAPGPSEATATCPAGPTAATGTQTSSSSTSVSPALRVPRASAAPLPHSPPRPPVPAAPPRPPSAPLTSSTIPSRGSRVSPPIRSQSPQRPGPSSSRSPCPGLPSPPPFPWDRGPQAGAG